MRNVGSLIITLLRIGTNELSDKYKEVMNTGQLYSYIAEPTNIHV